MASNSQPVGRASQLLPLSFASQILNHGDDDDDFQSPPLTQTSQRKPLESSDGAAVHRHPQKKPKGKNNPGKENASPASGPDPDPFHSVTQGCSLDCIPSSIDCYVGDTSGAHCSYGAEEMDGGLKVNKEGYLCNSVEARLLGPRICPAFGGQQSKDDGFGEEGEELDVLLKLCSGVEGGEDNSAQEVLIPCPLCGVDISGLNEEQRQVHTNDCLDKAENQAQERISPRKNEGSPSSMIESVVDPVQSHQRVVDASPVTTWLRNLGLDKYKDTFVREEIDWATLQWLTEEDLLSIGITALGPRKKIVHALNELRNRHVSPTDAQAELASRSNHATETHTDKSSVDASDSRRTAANKLITEFFPGLVNHGKKIQTTSKGQTVPEKSHSDSGNRHAVKRYIRNGKLKAIPTWCCIPGTPFRVDAFKYLRGDCCHWFLTHFHLDHYQGLTKSFCHGKIYCSSVTAKLVNLKIGIPWERLQILPLNQKINIVGTNVTCFDANHCPGSIMILFEPPNGKAVLHTGDFRFSEEMASILNGYCINTLILDTTYCNPQYDFPKQEAVIQFVIEAIQAEAFNPKTLFLIGSYTIGKERVFLEVARVLRKKIYINASKLHLLECLGFSKEDMQWFTVNEHESQIHVVPMWTIASFKRLKHIANQYASRFSLIVAFSPTGWTFGKGKKKSPGRRWQQGTIIRYEVPYSEHSSFTELKEFVKLLSPEDILPSVNNDGPDSAAAMVSFLLT